MAVPSRRLDRRHRRRDVTNRPGITRGYDKSIKVVAFGTRPEREREIERDRSVGQDDFCFGRVPGRGLSYGLRVNRGRLSIRESDYPESRFGISRGPRRYLVAHGPYTIESRIIRRSRALASRVLGRCLRSDLRASFRPG